MQQICELNKCTGCFACKNICPKGAIDVTQDLLGKTIPEINDNCIDCGLCVKICPVNKGLDLNYPIKCYATKSLDDSDKDCSSGGIATAFSRYVVNNNGYVYGAAFDNYELVAHKYIDSIDGLNDLKGSKYVQSYVGDTYKQVKEQLKYKFVLYIGTPCQIAGLKSFLNKDYDNLITVDLICHGTPPVSYLKEHIKSLNINDYDNLSFRGKYDFKLCLYDNNNLVYQKSNEDDFYFSSFFKGLTYRDNCYDCKYAGINRVSDITIGDFWGLDEKILNDNFNGKASVVLINSKKGMKFFENVKDKMIVIERNIDEAVKGNDQLRHPSPKHKLRHKFEDEYKANGFSKAIRKVYGKQIAINKILRLPAVYQLRQLRYNLKKRKLK